MKKHIKHQMQMHVTHLEIKQVLYVLTDVKQQHTCRFNYCYYFKVNSNYTKKKSRKGHMFQKGPIHAKNDDPCSKTTPQGTQSSKSIGSNTQNSLNRWLLSYHPRISMIRSHNFGSTNQITRPPKICIQVHCLVLL